MARVSNMATDPQCPRLSCLGPVTADEDWAWSLRQCSALSAWGLSEVSENPS